MSSLKNTLKTSLYEDEAEAICLFACFWILSGYIQTVYRHGDGETMVRLTGSDALARRKLLHLQRVIGVSGDGAQTLVHLLVLPLTLSFVGRKFFVFSVEGFVETRVRVLLRWPAVSGSLWISHQRVVTFRVLILQIAVDALLGQLRFAPEELLLDEHAGDDKSVQTQETVQDVAQLRVG